MHRGLDRTGELEFLQAVMKRGFVNIPRMLFDYTVDLELDYHTIGKLFAVMACVGGPGENPFGAFSLSRRASPHDFDQVRSLLTDLEQKELVLIQDDGDQLSFSFNPFFFRLKAIWDQYREQNEEEVAAGASDPAITVAQHILGRPLSDREVADITDWIESYGYDTDMVRAIIKEGQAQGVTRMSYLNKIARQWFEEGVRTPQDAEAYAQRYRKAAGKHREIIPYLGLKRQMSVTEHAMLDRWTEEWGFSNEVVIRACQEATGSNNPLQYVNRVLQSWHQRGVKVVADVEQLLDEHKRRTTPDPARPVKDRKTAAKSNVFLQREKKDDAYYDYIFKKFDE